MGCGLGAVCIYIVVLICSCLICILILVHSDKVGLCNCLFILLGEVLDKLAKTQASLENIKSPDQMADFFHTLGWYLGNELLVELELLAGDPRRTNSRPQ